MKKNGPEQNGRVYDEGAAGASGAPSQALDKVKGQVEPAFAFAISYLRLLAESTSLGALAVWFGQQGLEEHALANAKELAWGHELTDLLPESVGPERNSRFCTVLRRNPEADSRCHACDAHWIARARRGGRSWAYQCHAGLNEVIAPITVNGERVGQVMGGQLACSEQVRGGFEEVWERIKDIDGLDRHQLASAFSDLKVVTLEDLKKLRANLQAVARTIGALVENVSGLMTREKLLGHIRSHLERDYAWQVLVEGDSTEEEILVRAHALGFDEAPTQAIVIQADLTDRTMLGRMSGEHRDALHPMLKAGQHLLHETPNCIVASVRPGELVILLCPEKTRNPAAKALRQRELRQALEREMRTHVPVPVVIGVGAEHKSPAGIVKSYAEARDALSVGILDGTALEPGGDEGFGALTATMSTASVALRRAIADGNISEVEGILESQLRTVAACPERLGELRRLLFAQLILELMDALRASGHDSERIDEIQIHFARAFPGLRTQPDTLAWFHTYVLPDILDAMRTSRPRPVQLVAQACSMVLEALPEVVSRREVAEALGISDTHFGKVFHQRTGLTFREYVKRVRVVRAQKLLLLPKSTVGQVAGEVGYAGTAALTRAFHQVCGASPIAYRSNPGAFPSITLPDAQSLP